MRVWGLGILALAVAMLFLASGSVGSAAGEPARGGADGSSLKVKVVGLPGGEAGDVLVKGPHRFHRSLRHSTGLAGVPAGKYRIVVRPVVLTHAHKRIPVGSRAFAAKRVVKVRVRQGRRVTAVARYGTIRSSAVLVIGRAPLDVIGARRSPSAIVLGDPLAGRVKRGMILTAEPLPDLPLGLFHRVTRVEARGSRIVAHLEPASIWDAFPALDIEAVTPLGPSDGDGGARVSDVDDIDLSFAKSLTKGVEASCGGPPTGWSLSPSGSFRASVTSDLHRRYLALPYGKLTLTVKGKVGFSATVPTGAHCGLSVKGPGFQAAVVVFGVPIPVFGSTSFNVDVQADAPVRASATASLKATTGIDFNGTKSKPILELEKSATGSATATAGSVTMGPEFKAGLGADGINAHLSLEPQVAAKATRFSCQIAIGLVAGAGIDVLGFHPSYQPINPQTPVYTCPLPDGVFFDGSPGTGPPPATLGPYTMTRFGPDRQSIGPVVGVADPAGTLVFPQPLEHLQVGEGWATWSHGYQGDVYMSGDDQIAIVDLPSGTRAFYLYAEPNVFADFSVTATAAEGATSGPVTVYGESGAAYFGFYTTGSKTLSRIAVDAEDLVAIGEFGISR
jgi:hypothetical protein